MQLAERKATAVLSNHSDACVIGADTVVCVDGLILGKPGGREEARRFIKMLQGRSHCVYTGVCVAVSGKKVTEYESTEVFFDSMSEYEIDRYLDEGDYSDKAGAYGIQGAAARYVRRIDGCYYNVMGLPVNRLSRMLQKLL